MPESSHTATSATRIPLDLAGGRGEMGQALEGVGELLVVRPLAAAVAAPTAERRLFVVLIVIIVVITVVIAVTPVLPLPFLLSLSQSQFIKIPYMARKTPPYRNMRSAPAQAGHRTSPSEGGQIHPGAGGIRPFRDCLPNGFRVYKI